MAAIYLPENKLHPFVTQTQNEMHLKGKGSATGTMEIFLGKEKTIKCKTIKCKKIKCKTIQYRTIQRKVIQILLKPSRKWEMI